jgi:putative DNA primase/helicase
MPSFPVRNCNPWGTGIDVRGTGGQVVAAPSISGKGPYSVIDSSPPAPLPEWIRETLAAYQKAQRGEPSPLAPKAAPNGIRRAYGLSVVAARAKMLKETAKGGRNQALNDAAFACGQLAPDRIISEADAWAALSEAVLAPDFGMEEARRTFHSGWSSGMLQPFHPQWTERGHFEPRSWDDFGLGDRMGDHFGDMLRWNTDVGVWMFYQAGVWVSEDAMAECLAQAMIASLPETEGPAYSKDIDPSQDEKDSPRDSFEEQCRKWRTAEAPAKAVKVARRMTLMGLRKSHLDIDPLVVNLANGVWDARRRAFAEHAPTQYLTMQCSSVYDPHAACPQWDAFLERVQPDPEMRAYLYRIWGYSLTASLSEQAMFLHHGSGANGKSVANDIISRIAGSYAQIVPVETLILSSKTGQVPVDIARMDGRRYLAASETKAGKQLNEALIKQLTGGDTIAARYLYRDFFEFKPTGKIHLFSNHLVHISADPATHRRLHLIKWGESIPGAEQDKDLAKKILESEGSGVLNRLLGGLADWLALGDLAMPACAVESKQEYVREEDWRYAFVESCCDVTESQEGAPGRSTSELYAVYKIWYSQNQPGSKPMSINAFSANLAGMYPRTRIERWRGFPTLQVKQNPVQ